MTLDERNDKLNQKLEENPIDDIVQSLVRADGRRKVQVRWLAVSLVLDVLLTIAFGFMTTKTYEIAAQADNNRTAIIRNCTTANEARANNKALWDYLLALPTPNAPSIQQQQVRDNFSKFVDKTFAPRDCSTIK